MKTTEGGLWKRNENPAVPHVPVLIAIFPVSIIIKWYGYERKIMVEAVVLGLFAAGLVFSILKGFSILYVLIFGYILFFRYGRYRGFGRKTLLELSVKGISRIKGILLTFVLIGMITSLWRAGGTIPFIIYYASRLSVPSLFVLLTFLLCSLISTLTGTSVGSAATVGIICMTISRAMQIPPYLEGGAILSGIYVGDRCSPMSTSALLVSQVTGTDIFVNIRNMLKTALVPFLLTCLIYLIGGFSVKRQADSSVWELFARYFRLHWSVVLPAAAILLLSLLKVKVRTAMFVSILTSALVCVLIQGIPVSALPRLMIFGYHASVPELSAIMDGGGIMSMAKVTAIVCLSSSYSQLLKKTGLLSGIQKLLTRFAETATPFGTMLLTSVLSAMASCNQTLSIILTDMLCHKLISNAEERAVSLENSVIVIAALIPWSIACAAPLSAAAAPLSSIPAACYLYLLPLWSLLAALRKRRKNRS